MHPEGGCGFARHTPYERKSTPGAKVARFYCRRGRVTVSLLPDCLASRMPSTLPELERAAEHVESRSGSLEALAAELRPAAGRDADHVAGGVRWLRRRSALVAAALAAVALAMPERFAGCPPTLAGFRKALGVQDVLVSLREVAYAHLATLPAPLGLVPIPLRKPAVGRLQHSTGPDPP